MYSILPAVFGLSRIPALRIAHRAAALIALVALATGTAACSKESTSPRGPRLVYGASQALGDGTARTYITLDNSGAVRSLGVAISETAMNSLPMTPMPGMPSAAMLSLAIPAEGAATGYKHVMLDWNPLGHEPEHVYTHPHFDFHFFQITPAERDQMNPGNPEFAHQERDLPRCVVRAGRVRRCVGAGQRPGRGGRGPAHGDALARHQLARAAAAA